MKITSDENVNQAVEQMVQAIRNTDAYLEYQKQLARVKEQSELKRQIDEFRTRNFELQTSKDTNFDKLDQFTRENEAFRENPLVSDFLAADFTLPIRCILSEQKESLEETILRMYGSKCGLLG